MKLNTPGALRQTPRVRHPKVLLEGEVVVDVKGLDDREYDQVFEAVAGPSDPYSPQYDPRNPSVVPIPELPGRYTLKLDHPSIMSLPLYLRSKMLIIIQPAGYC